MNKKKIIIIISIVVILLVAIVGVIIYSIKNGKKASDYVGGVDDVDFSSYETSYITSSQTITSGGVYNISGDISGSITINAAGKDVKLVLNNANITTTDGPAIYVIEADNVYIELNGKNTINSTTTDELNGAIYSMSDLCIVGSGSLDITSNLDGIVSKDDLEIDEGTITITSGDDGIVGKDSVYILNGNITIKSTGDGIKTTNTEERGVITILDGNIDITSDKDGIQSEETITIQGGNIKIYTGEGLDGKKSIDYSMKGIKSESDITITGGTIEVIATDDAIHSNSNIIIQGGTISVQSTDDGIHADGDVTISDGSVDVVKSSEGIEGFNITIAGGDIKVKAIDDGLNASDGVDPNGQGNQSYISKSTLTISGGTLYVNSSGDGLDSNGNIFISGGTTYVDGPTTNDNSAIDYGDGSSYKFEITGGTLVAVGAKGMSVKPTSGTTVTTVLINTENAYKGKITFGNVTYEPSKAYNSVLICSNELSVGNTYDYKINNITIETITLSDKITVFGTVGNDGGPQGRR